MAVVTLPVFATGHPQTFFSGAHPSLNFSACLPQPLFCLIPCSSLHNLSFSSSRTWSWILNLCLPSWSSLPHQQPQLPFLLTEQSPSHISLSICTVPFPVSVSSSLLAFSSISSPRPPAGPHFSLCLPMPHLCPAAPFAAFSTTFSSQHSFCVWSLIAHLLPASWAPPELKPPRLQERQTAFSPPPSNHGAMRVIRKVQGWNTLSCFWDMHHSDALFKWTHQSIYQTLTTPSRLRYIFGFLFSKTYNTAENNQLFIGKTAGSSSVSEGLTHLSKNEESVLNNFSKLPLPWTPRMQFISLLLGTYIQIGGLNTLIFLHRGWRKLSSEKLPGMNA